MTIKGSMLSTDCIVICLVVTVVCIPKEAHWSLDRSTHVPCAVAKTLHRPVRAEPGLFPELVRFGVRWPSVAGAEHQYWV